jgi:hypothetical protein
MPFTIAVIVPSFLAVASLHLMLLHPRSPAVQSWTPPATCPMVVFRSTVSSRRSHSSDVHSQGSSRKLPKKRSDRDGMLQRTYYWTVVHFIWVITFSTTECLLRPSWSSSLRTRVSRLTRSTLAFSTSTRWNQVACRSRPEYMH